MHTAQIDILTPISKPVISYTRCGQIVFFQSCKFKFNFDPKTLKIRITISKVTFPVLFSNLEIWPFLTPLKILIAPVSNFSSFGQF